MTASNSNLRVSREGGLVLWPVNQIPFGRNNHEVESVSRQTRKKSKLLFFFLNFITYALIETKKIFFKNFHQLRGKKPFAGKALGVANSDLLAESVLVKVRGIHDTWVALCLFLHQQCHQFKCWNFQWLSSASTDRLWFSMPNLKL